MRLFLRRFAHSPRAVVLASIFTLAQPVLKAATLTWDVVSGDGAVVTDGSGGWLPGAGNWNNGAGDVNWSNANPDFAIIGAGGTAGAITLGADITASGISFEAVTGNYIVTGNTLTLAPGAAIGVNDDLATINSALAGTGALSKTGLGTLELGGANQFSGALSIVSGTARANHLSALGTTAAGTTVAAGATLELNTGGVFAGEALTLNGAGVAGGGALAVSATSSWSGAVAVSTAATIRVAGGVTWNATNASGLVATGLLTKSGAGTLALTGGIATGTGGVAVSEGTLLLPDNSVRWDGGNVAVGNSGTFRVQGTGTDSVGDTRTVTVAAGGSFDFQQTVAETLAGIFLNGSGAGGTGALVNSAAVFAGVLTTPVTLQSDSTIGVTEATGTLTFANAVTGAFGLTKVGAGSLSLTNNNNNVTGPVVIQAGKVQLRGTNNTFSGFFGASSVTVNNGATLQIDVSNGLAGHGTAPGNFVPVTINAGGTLAALPGTSSHIRGLLTLRGGTVSAPGVDTTNFGNLNFDGGVAAGGVATTSVISALDVTSSQSGATVYNVSPGATNGIDLDVTGTLIDASNVNETTLTKTGTGVMRLAGANTYQTGTTVLAGTLLVTGSISGTQNVRVASGALLGGSGRVGPIIANVNGSDAGAISPGSSAGLLTAPSVAGNTGLDFHFEFTLGGSPLYATAAASGNDLLHLTAATPFPGGEMNASNVIRVYFDHLADTYRGGFYAFDGQANPGILLQTAVGGATFDYFVRDSFGGVSFGGNNYTALASSDVSLNYFTEAADFATGTVTGAELQFTVVPEPSGALLLLGGLGALVAARRRRA